MNMPAMRNAAALQHVGGGVYRGTGQLMMAGRWDVTVDVMRGGQRLGSRQLSDGGEISRRRHAMKRLLCVIGLCDDGDGTAAEETRPAAPAPAGDQLDIRLTSPVEPRLGENTFEVMVMQGGQAGRRTRTSRWSCSWRPCRR